MKTKLTFILATMMLLGGCGLIKDAATVTIPTDLISTVTVTASGAKSSDPAVNNGISFSQSNSLFLGDNADLEPYLEKIREILIERLEVTISGLVTGQTINTISLDVAGVGNICTQTAITAANNSFVPEIDMAKLTSVAKKLKEDLSITYTIHGVASVPMVFVVSLTFEVEITAGALD